VTPVVSALRLRVARKMYRYASLYKSLLQKSLNMFMLRSLRSRLDKSVLSAEMGQEKPRLLAVAVNYFLCD